MPKQRITQEEILKTAFSLLRKEGLEKVNARTIANWIGCSVQPIYSYFSNMEELMNRLYDCAGQYLNEYVDANADKQHYFESIGKCHIFFAKEEKHLFRFLFLSPYTRVESLRDLYKKHGRADVTQIIQNSLGLSLSDAEELYTNMIIYTHGIACLIATDAANITYEEIHPKVYSAYLAFLSQLRKEKV
ncbi:TetR/AcrR family transcriptional regulator [Clostridium sp. KNHs216]|uniref:TetR/AcrR family transcriptional regulator n=1 Tax=Clostridium sp. KNHs216 TaxID=1550235 RepID=UPI00115112EE|nr:TetR/AcrR family transcriptional regulator [Clostridium sp. KNHs216]TQI66328.1 TetR family transcriptional regulator [Clostridium sp. KNHs216]